MSTLQRLLAELTSGPRAMALLEGFLTILLVAVGVAVAARAIPSFVRRLLRPRADRLLDTTRALTLQPLLESVLRYTLYFIATVMVLRAAGVDATAVLASAGVVGLAVGFGAQHLIRDVISGFFILAEGLIQVGDVISVGEHQGQVERISIRTTQLRKYSGELWTIPNGQITVFGNASRGYMRAIVDIPLSYRADVDRAMTVMRGVADEWAAAAGATVLSPPEVHSVLQFGDTRIVLRLTVTVSPGAQIAAERELRRRLKAALDREGVGSPFIRPPEDGPSETT